MVIIINLYLHILILHNILKGTSNAIYRTVTGIKAAGKWKLYANKGRKLLLAATEIPITIK